MTKMADVEQIERELSEKCARCAGTGIDNSPCTEKLYCPSCKGSGLWRDSCWARFKWWENR